MQKQAIRWRDAVHIHPAADLFPSLGKDALRELAADIDKNGLRHKVETFTDMAIGKDYLIDGRNRLDAMESLGWDLLDEHGKLNSKVCRGGPTSVGADPFAHVVSVNLHRLHLTAAQKREVLAKLLKAKPERSNRQTAKLVGVDDKTVAAVREDLHSRSEIPNVSNATDSLGRKQPTRKPRTKKPKAAPTATSEQPISATVADLPPEPSPEPQEPSNVTKPKDLEAKRIIEAISKLMAKDLSDPDWFARELQTAAYRFENGRLKEKAQ